MKKILFCFCAAALSLSCSSSDDSPAAVAGTPNYTFDITQSVPAIVELDEVTFEVQSTGTATNINSERWYVNDILNDEIQFGPISFQEPGTYHLRVEITYGGTNVSSATINKDITIAERPKNLVKISNVEILSYAGQGQFYVDLLGYYMKAKFQITELDEAHSPIIRYISSENTQNFDGGSMTYPISWNISSADYKVKVYRSGNYYPYGQQYYSTELDFYGAQRSSGGGAGAYYNIGTLYLDLNPYRSLHPTSITENTISGIEVRLTLEWQ